MAEATPIFIPLLNPNEPNALLAALHVAPGQYVHPGEVICTLETTKSTAELSAEVEGFLVGMAYRAGQTVVAGEIFGYIADSPDWSAPSPRELVPEVTAELPHGLRISQPALRLSQENDLDLTQLPSDVFITEKMVRQLLEVTSKPEVLLQTDGFGPNAIVIYGGGGHGKSLIDLIKVMGIYEIAGIVDDDLSIGMHILGVPVLGGANILSLLLKKGVHLAANAVGGIGNIQSRIKVFERLSKAGFSCPTLVHPRALIESSAFLAEGVQVMPLAYVGSEANVGFGVIVNTGAIISHDCQLGEYANLSPGAVLAGEVSIGTATLVGMGVTINLRVKVGENSRIGNGATVKQDVPAGSIVHAGTVWPS